MFWFSLVSSVERQARQHKNENFWNSLLRSFQFLHHPANKSTINRWLVEVTRKLSRGPNKTRRESANLRERWRLLSFPAWS